MNGITIIVMIIVFVPIIWGLWEAARNETDAQKIWLIIGFIIFVLIAASGGFDSIGYSGGGY